MVSNNGDGVLDSAIAVREQSRQSTISATAWKAPSELTLDEWVHAGKRLGSIGRGSSWWIGDWVNYGNGKFGEKYTRAARISGYDIQTLMNMAYVAQRFDFSRRREDLSWSHHAEIAALSVTEQDSWLELAATTRLSVHRMRDQLRAWRTSQPGIEKGAKSSEKPDSVVCPHCGHVIDPPKPGI